MTYTPKIDRTINLVNARTAADWANEYVTVADPDDPHGVPIFDGYVGQLDAMLVPGTYIATWWSDGTAYTLKIITD